MLCSNLSPTRLANKAQITGQVAARRGAAQPPSGRATLNHRPAPSCSRRPTARSAQALTRIPTPQPRRTTIGHFGFHAAFLLAGRYVSQKEGVAPNSACRAARPTEWRFSPPALRLRKAPVLGKPRRGPQLRLRTAVSPPLPPPPTLGAEVVGPRQFRLGVVRAGQNGEDCQDPRR